MENQLYIVSYSSANYCGAGNHCLVWARNEDEAREFAEPFAEDDYYEQDVDQLYEDGLDDIAHDGPYANINTVELLEDSEYEQWVKDPAQASFYPYVN